LLLDAFVLTMPTVEGLWMPDCVVPDLTMPDFTVDCFGIAFALMLLFKDLAGTRRCEVGGGGGGRRFGGGGDKRFGAIATVDGRTIVATILVGRRKLVGQSDRGTIVCVCGKSAKEATLANHCAMCWSIVYRLTAVHDKNRNITLHEMVGDDTAQTDDRMTLTV
jgi:hypothetical protein